MKQQIIVVEGYHDQVKINSVFPNTPCITTNGSEISKETLNLIYQASLKNEVILFLDPDFPGKKITQKILDTGGDFTMAFIQKSKAISKNGKKVGIEHVSKEDIYKALNEKIKLEEQTGNISLKDLMSRGLANRENSSLLRRKLCNSLNIPFSNSKTLIKYLNLLRIKLDRIDEVLDES